MGAGRNAGPHFPSGLYGNLIVIRCAEHCRWCRAMVVARPQDVQRRRRPAPTARPCRLRPIRCQARDRPCPQSDPFQFQSFLQPEEAPLPPVPLVPSCPRLRLARPEWVRRQMSPWCQTAPRPAAGPERLRLWQDFGSPTCTFRMPDIRVHHQHDFTARRWVLVIF